jgi:hypothetical protein
MKNYVFNIIKPLSKDKRNKLDVRLSFVLASSEKEAEKAVANNYQKDTFGQCRIVLRSTWEEGEVISWGFQSWDRKDWDSSLKTAREILGDEYEPYLDSYVTEKLKEAGKSDDEIRQIAFEHESKRIEELNLQ